MKEHPLVSVLMTSYNREKYIADAIESVLASSYTNFELIIVDDGSKDNTVAIARSYEQKDARIKVYVNEKNLGDYINRNKAASYAKGKYIKYVDSDDLIFSWGLQVMVTCIEQYPEAAFGLIYAHGYNYIFPKLISSEEACKIYFFQSRLLHQGPGGSIIRTDIFNSIGGFSGKQFMGDTELWLRLTKISGIVLIPPGLTYWREHEGQQTIEEQKDNLIDLTRYQLKKEFLSASDCPIKKEESAIALKNLTSIKCRTILLKILKGHFSRALADMKNYDLHLNDFLHALKKINTPSK